jgi:hypothetical protein
LAQPAARELIGRLPRTFRPSLNDQVKNWDLLFPAEQRQLEAQLDWMARLPPPEFQALFAPIVEVEGKMELPRWESNTAGMTVQDAGLLARSPLYPRWRSEVEKVFSRIDEAVEKSGRIPRVPRLAICVLPPGLPLADQSLWPVPAKRGTWVALNGTFDRFLSPLASALAACRLPSGLEPIEGMWILECEPRLSSLAESTPATVLCWDTLAAARREFLARLNTIQRSLSSVDRVNQELRQMDLNRLLGRPAVPRVREFVRAVFLSGNGSLVFNNSFVQWGASEALRRVQPRVLMACFGSRQKLKPFSSVVLFEDQNRSNPVGDEVDPAGSLVDGMLLAEYVQLAAERLAGGQPAPLILMAACGLDRILVLGPRAPAPASGRLTVEELTTFAQGWLSV